MDDASDEQDTAALAARTFGDARIRSFHSETPRGVAGGRNVLMQHARGELLVSIDDDAVFIGEDALAEIEQSFSGDPGLGALAFRIINIVGNERSPLVPFPHVVVSRDPEVVQRRALVSSFRGGGHAIRKCVVESVGNYREDMMFGEEEMDLAYRIIQGGHRIVYEPSVIVEHYPMPSVVGKRGNSSQRELYYHVRNRIYLAYRYLPLKFAIPYVVIWMARYALRSMKHTAIDQFLKGVLAAPRFVRGVRREVLNPQALAYLAENGGRLWY
jgi:GT2 family glycosyltransferase